MKVTQLPPVHAANLVANSGNTAYGVDVIGPIGTNPNGTGIKIQTFSFKNMHSKYHLQSVGLLIQTPICYKHHT